MLSGAVKAFYSAITELIQAILTTAEKTLASILYFLAGCIDILTAIVLIE